MPKKCPSKLFLENFASRRSRSLTDTTRLLLRALLVEGILAEIFTEGDVLGTSNMVRFTYEQIRDYSLSLGLLPERRASTPVLLAQLADRD